MSTVNMTNARAELPHLVERAQHEAITLSRHGERAAVLVSPAVYDRLMAAQEDLDDIAAFDEAMDDEGPNIPWDEVKADLGLTR